MVGSKNEQDLKPEKNLVLFLFSFVSKKKIGACTLWGWVCLLQEVALPLGQEDRPGSGLGEQRLEAGCLELAAFSA